MDWMDALKGALAEQIMTLKPVPFTPQACTDHEYMELNPREDREKWRQIMEENLKTARYFEIHCWNEEPDALQLALKYGQVKPFDWAHGTVVYGPVTQEFIAMLLDRSKEHGKNAQQEITPFFTIMLDNGFHSEHYGTELIIETPHSSL